MTEFIKEDYHKICNKISEKKIADALLLIEKYIAKTGKNDIIRNFEKQKETYNYLLEYTFKGVNDPEKPKIYKGIQKKLIEIAESLKDESVSLQTNLKTVTQKNSLDIDKLRQKITIEEELNLLTGSSKDTEDIKRKERLYKIFFLLWFTDMFDESDKNALKKAALSKKLKYYEKSVIVSAITISLLRRFDANKFHVLFEFYDMNETFVWNRALVGLIMAFYKYDERIDLYDDLTGRLAVISEDSDISTFTEDVILQFIRSKETEKISKKLRDEIIPEMEKFRPKIQDKLNLDEIISDSLGEDKNPDWEEIFDDAPDLLGKMADFSKMQLEGSDVFMSAFAMFKNFPFFKETANWFMPFYSENSEVFESFSDFNEDFDVPLFTKGLENSAFICNSDKYSFCMNIKMMPSSQRGMIIELFKAEMEQMKDISKEDEILNKKVKDKYIFTRYIQDLYRFFKLHPLRNEFDDFFEYKLDIHNTTLFKILTEGEIVSGKIAELYFKKEFYTDAIDVLKNLKAKGKKGQKNYEKLGFAYQKINDWQNALDAYLKAELFDEPSLWLTKKIAFCYRKLRQYKNALKYYQLAEKEQEENLHIQANIGHCYLSLQDYENALKKYFKVEYYDPDNIRAMRPIAWCSFVLGKFDTSEKYYQKILKHKVDAFDYINYGHVLFSKDEKMKAVENYLKAIEISNIKTFEDSINEDLEILLKHNPEKTDIDLLIDYVKTKTI